jgi:hypothetical protein
MRTVTGDIWMYGHTHFITVPTNIGWTKGGLNVMGRGVAKQASQRCPDLTLWYGAECQKYREHTPILQYPGRRLLLFPVKPLDVKAPWLSWHQQASLRLIEIGLPQLKGIPGDIALPLLGCGNGKLDPADVMPLLEKYLDEDRFLLVRFDK